MSNCEIDENEMARCVRNTLKEYFKDLDGEHPCSGMYDMVINSVEKPLIETVLQQAGGNLSRTAEMLGMNRNTLRKKMLQHGIS